MATSKAVRADDVSGLNIATASFTEDAVTKDVQRVILNNSTDGTMATVGSAGLKVDPSGATSPVSIAATVNVRPSDGTNPVTKTFDLDSGAGTEYNLGVGLRKAASGGSVEAGTSSDPLRVDPTGTTVQPVSASTLPLPTGAATLAKQPAFGTAGTPSADVISIQGVTSMTPVKVDGSGVTQPVSGTFFQSTQPVSIAATVGVQPVGNGAVLSNQQAVTASAVALASNACRKALIKALVANTINVYVGASGITTGTGYELAPGEAVNLDITNTNLVFVIASTTGASVSWIATN